MDLSQYLDPSIASSLQAGGYIIMLGLMIIEGPIVTFVSAFLASMGVFDIYLVFFLGWCGDVLGDLIFYAIGRYGLGWLHSQRATDASDSKNLLQKLDSLISKNLTLAILIIKFTPYAPPIGLTYLGQIRIDIKKYLRASMPLCVPIPVSVSLVGFHLGYMETIFSKYSGVSLIGPLMISVGVIILSIVGFLYMRRLSSQLMHQDAHDEKTEIDTTTDGAIIR